jgi:peptidoglycan/LPS O-acetylase OafA/YrhL
MMPSANKNSFRYLPGLDGLRALAVLAVMAYHLNLPFTSGGFLGVTVFFVLSGFLITSLLAWEWNQTEKIDLKQFWIRRAKRLLPAMFLLLILLNVLVPLLRPELVSNLRQDTIAAMFYYSNWYYIFQDLSYFESFQTPSLLTHFWSLAIEEQFYIIWAIVILFLFTFVKKQTSRFLLILIGAAISAIWMTFMYDPNLDPSRVYYGTDTRIFSLLIGASFAIIFPNQPSDQANHKKKWVYEWMGIIGVFVFLLMVVFTNQYGSFVYQGGMVILSITTAMWVVSLSMPFTVQVNKLLEWKPLKWIGIRSYGIYIWHYPIFLLMKENVNTGGVNYRLVIFQIVLTFIVASLSYTFVEKPIRQGKFRFDLKISMVITTTVVGLIFFTNSGMVSFPNVGAAVEEDGSEEPHEEVVNPPQDLGKDVGIIYPPFHKEDSGDATPPVKGDDGGENSPPPDESNDEDENLTPPPSVVTKKITAIGDSVLISPASYLKEKFPNITIDVKVSRQMRDASEIVNQHSLGEVVIIELGTNGSFPEKTLTDLIEKIGSKRKILFVNVRVPRPWESIVNKTLAEVSKKHPNTTVVDWYGASANHDEYFTEDGVHLKPNGAKAYASMIEKAVQQVVSTTP